jgi:hypothetical protein
MANATPDCFLGARHTTDSVIRLLAYYKVSNPGRKAGASRDLGSKTRVGRLAAVCTDPASSDSAGMVADPQSIHRQEAGVGRFAYRSSPNGGT